MVRPLATAGPVASFKKNEQRSKSRDETIGVVRLARHPNSIPAFARASKRVELAMCPVEAIRRHSVWPGPPNGHLPGDHHQKFCTAYARAALIGASFSRQ